MYYLAKFCRICVQTDLKLVDLDNVDFDRIKLSEKLEVCTKMVVTRENLSTEICLDCLNKLRTSYQFLNMCKKSTKTLHGYYKSLLGHDDVNKECINSDLHVIVTPVKVNNSDENVREKRKRITKEQRCSLLKKLLTTTEPKTHNTGGLKNIINFTQNYEFGNGFNKNITPLDKLKAFSDEFFNRDFNDFKNTILYIIENNDNSDSEDEDLFNNPPYKEEVLKCEEVIIEPDIRIKTEIDYDENDPVLNYSCKEEPETYESPTMSETVYNDYNSNSMLCLNNFVGNYQHKRTFSASNVRCRTRENPYINPLLKQQFLYRSFRCDKCNRYFKSPGYLKAHYSKVH